MFIKRKKLDRKRLSTLFTVLMIIFMMVSSVFTSKLIIAEDTETDVILLCEKEEHTHDETCFDENNNLICEKEEHTHGEECFEKKTTEENTEENTEEVTEKNNNESENIKNNNEEKTNQNNESEEQTESEDIIFDDFDEEALAIIIKVPTCGIEEHTHDETCVDENNNLICEKEEHTHTEEEDENGVSCFTPVQNNVILKAPMLKAGPLRSRIQEIPFSSLITREQDRINHTYVLIGGEKYHLTRNGFEPNLVGDISVGTSVRMNLLFNIDNTKKEKGITYFYKLPDNLAWDKKDGKIKSALDFSNVGEYKVEGNTVYISFNDKFIEEGSGNITTRVFVDGHIKETDPTEDDGTVKYKFSDDAELGPVKVNNNATVELSKRTATAYDLDNPIVVDGSTVTITYIVEVRTVGEGTIENIEIVDELTTNDLDAKYVNGSFKFGTQPNTNNLNDPSKPEDVAITGFTNSDTSMSFTLKKWNSKEGPQTFYVTYEVTFTPKRYGDTHHLDYVSLHNEVKAKFTPPEATEPTEKKSQNDFVYKNFSVKKRGNKNNSESYVADWTAVFNDYAPLFGVEFDGSNGKTIIRDKLGNNHSKYLKPDDGVTDPSNFVITEYKPNANNTGWASGNLVKDFSEFKKANGDPIESLLDFVNAYFSDGVQVPITNRYDISYQTRLNQDIIDSLTDLSDVEIKNEAENGGDDTPGDPGKDDSTIGVGPAKPTITKEYKPKEGDSTTKARWNVTLEIKDEKYQTDGYIYDYFSKLQELDKTDAIEFIITDLKDKQIGNTMEFEWDDPIVTIGEGGEKYINNGDNKPKGEQDVFNENFKENFKFNVVEAVNRTTGIDDKSKIIKDGKLLPGYKFTISFRTDLIMNKEDATKNSFDFRNDAFAKALKDDKKIVVEDNATTVRNIINKLNLDNNQALYNRAYSAVRTYASDYKEGEEQQLRDFDFQEMPWVVSCLVMDENLVLSDSFHRSTEKHANGYDDMTLDQSSLIIYYTEKASDTGDVSNINWNKSDSEEHPITKLLTKGKDYTVETLYEEGVESGFKVHFNNLPLEENGRVAMFYVTRAKDYDNNVIYRYENTTSPDGYGGGQTGPKATSYTLRRYEVLDKKGILAEEDEDVDAVYTIDVNKSRLTLNNGKILNLEDKLSPYLNFAGGFKFYEVAEDGTKTEKENGKDGYSFNVSDPKIIKITVPDDTYVIIEYKAVINKSIPDNENIDIINTVDLHGERVFEATNSLKVYVVEHNALAWHEDGHLRIRLFKYDLKRPIYSLPGTKFLLSEYVLPEVGKELIKIDPPTFVIVEKEEEPVDPGNTDPATPEPQEEDPVGTAITNKDGQFEVEGLYYNHIYKIEETEPLPGYEPTQRVFYVVFVDQKNKEDFEGLTIDGKPITVTFANQDADNPEGFDSSLIEYYISLGNKTPTPPGRRIPKTGD